MSNPNAYSAAEVRGVTGLGEGVDRTASKGFWLLIGLFLAAWWFILIGAPWYDRYGNVKLKSDPKQPSKLHGVLKWTSWFAWTTGLMAMVLTAPAWASSQIDQPNPSPLGAVAVFFGMAAFMTIWPIIHARRISAWKAGQRLSYRTLFGDLAGACRPGKIPHNAENAPFIKGGFWVVIAVALTPVIAMTIWPAGVAVGYIFTILALTTFMAVAIRAAHGRAKYESEDWNLTCKYGDKLAHIFAINPGEFDTKTALHYLPGGSGFSIKPQPAALATADPSAVEERLRLTMPGFMIQHEPDIYLRAEQTILIPVDSTREAERQHAERTGGVVIGEELLEDLGEQYPEPLPLSTENPSVRSAESAWEAKLGNPTPYLDDDTITVYDDLN